MSKYTQKLVSRSAAARRLTKGETCAITLRRPKTAALLFDRVYSASKDVPFDLTPGWARSTGGEIEVGGSANRALRFGPTPDQLEEDIMRFPRDLMDFLAQKGFRPVPYYESLDALHSVYSPGDTGFVGLALEDVLVVDEEVLDWRQVLEFRQDSERAADYRRLVHWFDKEMKEQELTFVRDELAVRYEKYKSALSKHGIKARAGELLSILTTLQALGSVGIGTLIGTFTTPPLGVVAGLMMLDATTTVKIRDIRLEQNHAKRYGDLGYMAFAHEMNSLTEKTHA